MAHARPVVASSWSGYRDLVRHGETGFLVGTKWSVDTGAAVSEAAMTEKPYSTAHRLAQGTIVDVEQLRTFLLQLIRNPEAARSMGEQGRQRASALFSWQRVSRLFNDLWREQIRRAPPRRKPAKPLPDYNLVFSGYADECLLPTDRVVAVDEPLDGEVLRAPTPGRPPAAAAGVPHILRLLRPTGLRAGG
jgi:hypothetical protein